MCVSFQVYIRQSQSSSSSGSVHVLIESSPRGRNWRTALGFWRVTGESRNLIQISGAHATQASVAIGMDREKKGSFCRKPARALRRGRRWWCARAPRWCARCRVGHRRCSDVAIFQRNIRHVPNGNVSWFRRKHAWQSSTGLLVS